MNEIKYQLNVIKFENRELAHKPSTFFRKHQQLRVSITECPSSLENTAIYNLVFFLTTILGQHDAGKRKTAIPAQIFPKHRRSPVAGLAEDARGCLSFSALRPAIACVFIRAAAAVETTR